MMGRFLGSLGAAMLLAVFSIATTHGQSLARSDAARPSRERPRRATSSPRRLTASRI